MSLNINHVTKQYATGVIANKDINFKVLKNQCLGLVGANGSGKTTLIRQIFGILSTTEGSIDVDGTDDYLERLSYVPQYPAVYPALSVKENIDVALRYTGKKRTLRAKTEEAVLGEIGLAEYKDQKGYMLSGGQSKLMALGCALALDKEYMILDEPTSMVDISSKQRIWKIIEDQKKKKGILIASHDMEEVKKLCDRVVILKKGEVIFNNETKYLGAGICIGNLVVSNSECAKKIFESRKDLEVESDNYRKIKLNTKSLEEMQDILHEIEAAGILERVEIEYPAFTEGVMSYVG